MNDDEELLEKIKQRRRAAGLPVGEPTPFTDTMVSTSYLLTQEELDICSQLGELHVRILKIMGNNNDNDGFESMLHIHALQNMVMSQAARRGFPHLFRQLGEKS